MQRVPRLSFDSGNGAESYISSKAFDWNTNEIPRIVRCKNKEKIYIKENKSHTKQYLRGSANRNSKGCEIRIS